MTPLFLAHMGQSVWALRSERLVTATLEFIKCTALHFPPVLSLFLCRPSRRVLIRLPGESTAPPAGCQQNKAVGLFLGKALVANETAAIVMGPEVKLAGHYRAGHGA